MTMKYELHLSVSEMNLLLPAIESYIKLIQTSNVPAIKANGKSKVDRLKKTAEKLKLLTSYAKISTQAEKTRKQAEAKKQKYFEMVFGSGAGKADSDNILTVDPDELNKMLKIDDVLS